MLDCNAVAGRQRNFIVGLCVITEIEGTVSFLPETESNRYIITYVELYGFYCLPKQFEDYQMDQRSGHVVGMG